MHPAIKNYLITFLDESSYYALIDYYVTVFERNENGYKNLYPKIEKEFDELKSLLLFCLERNSLSNAASLWDFFSIYLWDRGYWYMLREFGERLLDLAYKEDYTVATTIIIRDLAWLYIWQGEFLKTYKLLRNKKLQETIKDNMLLGTMHQQLGFIFSRHKLQSKALANLSIAKTIFEEISNKHNYAKTLLYLGHSYENIGKFTQALKLYEASLDIARKHNYMETESKSHYYIGEVYKKRKEFNQAKMHFNYALSIDNAVKRRSGIGWNKHSLSEIAQDEGDSYLADKLHREAHEAFLLVGVNPSLH